MLKLLLPLGYCFATHDYNRAYTFKIYNEDDTAFDASTYNAPIIKVFEDLGITLIESITGSWINQSSGIGSFSFTQASHLTCAGVYYLEIQLEKIGTVLSTGRRRVFVVASPP